MSYEKPEAKPGQSSTDPMAHQPPTNDRPSRVGYRNPPEHTRWRPGQSGNPKGRPRGSKKLSELLNDALEKQMQVTYNGRRQKMTARESIVLQLIAKAANGDLKAAAFILAHEQAAVPDTAHSLENARDQVRKATSQQEAVDVYMRLVRGINRPKDGDGT